MTHGTHHQRYVLHYGPERRHFQAEDHAGAVAKVAAAPPGDRWPWVLYQGNFPRPVARGQGAEVTSVHGRPAAPLDLAGG